jgi:hypothetical protein
MNSATNLGFLRLLLGFRISRGELLPLHLHLGNKNPL